jgi:glutathionylspermidine synthase
MKREQLMPRANWRQRCEDAGFHFHSIDGIYWDERACYRFTESQIDTLEDATNTLHAMCLELVGQVIQRGDLSRFALPEGISSLVEASWKAQEPSLFGRFDLSWDGAGAPKMLEYNADTPTALIEASVAQWHWLEDVKPDTDQFNSLHEKLIARWSQMIPTGSAIHFCAVRESEEDWGNVDYLRDTALQAGMLAPHLVVEDIGWDGEHFTDADETPIETLFKLYPWEWLVREEFAPHLFSTRTRFIEPAWKMLLSNKAILPLLWEAFPGHPNLLPAAFDANAITGERVRKPLYSREGANVTIETLNGVIAEPGQYGEEGMVTQAYAPLPRFGGNYTVVGSWVIGDQAAGIGLREDNSPITKNTSRFVPHYFV